MPEIAPATPLLPAAPVAGVASTNGVAPSASGSASASGSGSPDADTQAADFLGQLTAALKSLTASTTSNTSTALKTLTSLAGAVSASSSSVAAVDAAAGQIQPADAKPGADPHASDLSQLLAMLGLVPLPTTPPGTPVVVDPAAGGSVSSGASSDVLAAVAPVAGLGSHAGAPAGVSAAASAAGDPKTQQPALTQSTLESVTPGVTPSAAGAQSVTGSVTPAAADVTPQAGVTQSVTPVSQSATGAPQSVTPVSQKGADATAGGASVMGVSQTVTPNAAAAAAIASASSAGATAGSPTPGPDAPHTPPQLQTQTRPSGQPASAPTTAAVLSQLQATTTASSQTNTGQSGADSSDGHHPRTASEGVSGASKTAEPDGPDQVSASLAVAAGAPSTASPNAADQSSVHPGDVVAQIAHQADLYRLPGNKGVRIQLHPDDLGGVQVTLRYAAGGNLELHINVEHASTGALVEAGWGQLRDALATQGFSPERLVMSVTAPSAANQMDFSSNNNSQSGSYRSDGGLASFMQDGQSGQSRHDNAGAGPDETRSVRGWNSTSDTDGSSDDSSRASTSGGAATTRIDYRV